MTRRIVLTSALCVAALTVAASVSAQVTNMSDGTGANAGLFSRGLVRAFPAPPAPDPVPIVTPAVLAALCVERADALAVYTSLSGAWADDAQLTALMLMRGGPGAETAANHVTAALLGAGADRADVDRLVSSVRGLLSPVELTVPDIAAASVSYNALVASAPVELLAHPPAELTALRLALGRLTAASQVAFAAERVYPDLPPARVRYANDATWLQRGQPIELLGERYLPFGAAISVGERRFTRIADYDGVWVLAETPATTVPETIYVPVRTYCDLELVPLVRQERIIKRSR